MLPPALRCFAVVLGLPICLAACSDDDHGAGGSGGESASTAAPATGSSTTASSASSSNGSSSSSASGTSASGSTSAGSGGGGGDQLCNGEQCHADQICEPSGCTFPCTGASVPGDYATLEAAVQALAGIPGSVICLAAQDYAEPGFVIYGDDLTIVGPSASETTISLMPSAPVRKNVTFRGVTFTTPMRASGALNVSVDVHAIGVRFEAGIDLDRGGSGSGASDVAVTVDGCDIRGGVFALDGSTGLQGDYFFTAMNSWFHDTPDDACVRASLSNSSAALTFDLRNNTIVGCETGVDVYRSSISGGNAVTLSLFNNIIANHTALGISIDVSGDEIVSTGNNALFGNANNYAGAAVDGPGYVKMDCLLDDAAAPPSLGAGSPCLDAADAAQAPTNDYWGAPRSATPDIGAVEVP